jgi:hypothetical protein
MTESDALVTIDQKEVAFYDDLLTAVRVETGQIYVALPSMCNALGLNIQAQSRRINRHEVLSSGYTKLAILASFENDESTRRRMGVLRADLVPLWLAGLSAKSVKSEMRPKIVKYQQEAAQVLWEAFQDGRLTADPTFDELLRTESDAVQAYKMAAAIMKLARTQIMIEARLENSEAQLTDHEQRLEQIETHLGSSGTITPDQATAISQAVKTVARELGAQTGRNEYGGVYGELYRRYRIPTYRELPTAKYNDAITWLGDWLESLTGDNPF